MSPDLIEQFEQVLQGGAVLQNILLTIAVIVGLLLTRMIILRVIHHRATEPEAIYRSAKMLGYVLVLIGLALLALIWLDNPGTLVTSISLLSAALVIALQDPITNVVGWLFIIWRRPFEVGDRIQIGSEGAGDVIDLRVFQFTLMELGNWVDADQSTGRILHIPNRKVFSDSIANYNRAFGYIWNEMPVLVTFESDWRKAKTLLQTIGERHAAHLSEVAREQARQAARRYMIRSGKLTPIVYTRVKDSGVRLTLRYLCQPQQRRSSEEAIWEDILDAFHDDPTIEFAYPTQRIYYQPPE